MLERAPSVPYGSARLAERRRIRRRRGIIAFTILFIFVIGAFVWGLQQSQVRISHVDVYSTEASIIEYAKSEMRGNYLGIIPRDSIFFFPASGIRADILSAHSDIAAVSISRTSLTSISIKTNDRIPIARWCGVAPTLVASSTKSLKNCFVFDAGGLIFAAVASSTQTLNNFKLYAPLEGDPLEPLLATLARSEKLPSVFDFARQLDTFGSPTVYVVLRGDEVDDTLASGTRITYVLGHEQDAFTALVSARSDMNLTDGSIDYVDLRFDRKVYLKQKK
ncbi:MAG: hypothetical protein NUV60_02630 [Patescibacteria group bacterium]|nr:hypothetical protein [Patescibacteria group bacterium]